MTATKHDFPVSDVGDGRTLNVSFFSAPRTSNIPDLNCPNCLPKQQKAMRKNGMVDDRMHTSCTMKGKHRCDDFEEYDGVNIENKLSSIKKLCQNHKKCANGSCEASTSKPKLKVNIGKAQLYSMNYSNLHRGDSKNEKRIISPDEEQKLKSAKMDVAPANRHTANDLKKDKGQLLLDAIERSAQKSTNREIQNREPCANKSECNNAKCDKSESDILSIRERNRNNFNIYVDKHCDSPIPRLARKEIGDISNVGVHRRAGARQKIDFSDAGDGGCVPKCDGQTAKGDVISTTSEKKTKDLTVEVPRSFEESVLNGRLEPVSTVHGFTAELGASGTFVPKHLIVPFFDSVRRKRGNPHEEEPQEEMQRGQEKGCAEVRRGGYSLKRLSKLQKENRKVCYRIQFLTNTAHRIQPVVQHVPGRTQRPVPISASAGKFQLGKAILRPGLVQSMEPLVNRQGLNLPGSLQKIPRRFRCPDQSDYTRQGGKYAQD
ncbi:hypothetical protein NQ317_018205 [Molorchus minor]|uniref:Atos-like conserved domain-containing protein n=1 Tax=Molorchus minor TaxID=1323400 RepID=A0ABQ9JFN2_9CUCU|nr:hypothetical protein NQ317_018205 [Molorchus minor]